MRPSGRLAAAASLVLLAARAAAQGAGRAEPGVDELGGLCSASGNGCAFSCVLFDGKRLCVPERGVGEGGCGGEPEDGVCRVDLVCGEGGVCRAAAWNEECGSANGKACGEGLECVNVPQSKGRSFPQRCFKVVGVGETCTESSQWNQEEESLKFVCEDLNGAVLCRGDGGGGEAKCVLRPSPSAATNAGKGESCVSLPCFDYDWCDPGDQVCKDLPGDGEACAPNGGNAQGNVCRSFENLFCSEEGFCRKQPGGGKECFVDRGIELCAARFVCADAGGGVRECRKEADAGQACDDGVHACGSGMVCSARFCAEDGDGGLFRKCGGEVGCGAGRICVQAQDGVQRCLRESPVVGPGERGDYGDACDVGEPSDEILPRSLGEVGCRSGYECKADPTGGDYERKYCYTVQGAQKGELCNKGDGGQSCVSEDGNGGFVSCEYYERDGQSVQLCAGRAQDGAGCNGDSNDACLVDEPATASCDDSGVCRIDSDLACTAAGGCGDPERQCVEVNGTPTCLDYQRELGETCATGPQPLDASAIWELKCKPEFTCYIESLGRFDVSGVCFTLVGEGQQCDKEKFLACDGDRACINGSCQNVRR